MIIAPEFVKTLIDEVERLHDHDAVTMPKQVARNVLYALRTLQAAQSPRQREVTDFIEAITTEFVYRSIADMIRGMSRAEWNTPTEVVLATIADELEQKVKGISHQTTKGNG